MSPIRMPKPELDVRPSEPDPIHEWRAQMLREQGVPQELADIFADRVDWRAVAALVESGCPGALALEIVR